jgi:hypothetical protein
MESGTEQTNAPWWQRYILATIILVFSFIGIIIIAYLAIFSSRGDNAMQILNITLPVFASWVGTILAFYFGRENFESANKQIREIITRMTPEELEKIPVTDLMRKYSDTARFKIPESKGDSDITLNDIRSIYNERTTRLPVVNPDDSPKYMIHKSRTDEFIVGPPKQEDPDTTLQQFIEDRKKTNLEFGLNKGFIVVSENTTIADAKAKMDSIALCQDIFVTKGGTEKEPLTGWISNNRLGKYLNG